MLSCEHASRALPEWRAEPADEPLLADHWGWDIGAGDLTRALAARLGAVAVLSCFSRLVCDPNRDPEDPSFVVEAIDGHTLSWNRGVDAAERARRRELYYAPYHAEIDRVIGTRLRAGRPTRLCSIHSFTPSYRGERREMELGVLYDGFDAEAERLAGRLADAGFATALNAPYSGYAGLIHAARRHGRAHGIVYLELELRQDLIADATSAARVAERIAPALRAFALETSAAVGVPTR